MVVEFNILRGKNCMCDKRLSGEYKRFNTFSRDSFQTIKDRHER